MGYYTLAERLKIETFLEAGLKPVEIAEKINRSFTSVYREIKRGTVTLIDTNLKPYQKYCADVGQRKMQEAGRNKGASLKLENDAETVGVISDAIINDNLSPYVISVQLFQSDKYTRVCKSTIYNYVKKGLIHGVKKGHIIYQMKKQKHKKAKQVAYDKTGKKSIEERPESILKRDVYGHWEIDTVYSGKDKSKTALLVLSERMTREEIIIKIPNRKAQSVVDALNDLETQLSASVFRQKFKTITADNGKEFAMHKAIENSCLVFGKRTEIYFCHPYCSGERGTNENTNKLIRRFIPKGDDIGRYTAEQIKNIEDKINNYPRRIFGGLSSNEYKKLCNIVI